MTSTILNILDCPVCLNIPTSTPIYQCVSNGHVVCKNCILQLNNKCPICRQSTGFSRCLIAEKLLFEYLKFNDNLPKENIVKTKFCCTYRIYGCSQFSSYDHELYCPYRLIYCPDLICHKRLSLNSLIDEHCQEEHVDMIVKPGYTPMVFRLYIRDSHWALPTSYKPIRIFQDQFNFFRGVHRDENRKSWYFWVYFDGKEYEATSFQVVYQIMNDHQETILTFNDYVVPLDYSIHQIMQDCKSLVLSDEFMRRRIVRNNEFYLRLNINKISV